MHITNVLATVYEVIEAMRLTYEGKMTPGGITKDTCDFTYYYNTHRLAYLLVVPRSCIGVINLSRIPDIGQVDSWKSYLQVAVRQVKKLFSRATLGPLWQLLLLLFRSTSLAFPIVIVIVGLK